MFQSFFRLLRTTRFRCKHSLITLSSTNSLFYAVIFQQIHLFFFHTGKRISEKMKYIFICKITLDHLKCGDTIIHGSIASKLRCMIHIKWDIHSTAFFFNEIFIITLSTRDQCHITISISFLLHHTRYFCTYLMNLFSWVTCLHDTNRILLSFIIPVLIAEQFFFQKGHAFIAIKSPDLILQPDFLFQFKMTLLCQLGQALNHPKTHSKKILLFISSIEWKHWIHGHGHDQLVDDSKQLADKPILYRCKSCKTI